MWYLELCQPRARKLYWTWWLQFSWSHEQPLFGAWSNTATRMQKARMLQWPRSLQLILRPKYWWSKQSNEQFLVASTVKLHPCTQCRWQICSRCDQQDLHQRSEYELLARRSASPCGGWMRSWWAHGMREMSDIEPRAKSRPQD